MQTQTTRQSGNGTLDELTLQLKEREVKRITTLTRETVEYDTGQTVTRKLMKIDNPRWMAVLTGQERSTVVQTEISENRTGYQSASRPGEGGANFNGRDTARGYPELRPFTSVLDTVMMRERLTPVPPAILGFLPTLAGHGNMPPWALLHPRVIWAYIAGTIFPFEKQCRFDLKRGAEHFRTKGMLIDPAQITESHDGFVACVGHDGLLSDSRRQDQPTALKIRIFNPCRLTAAKKEERLNPQIPSRNNSLFEIHLYADGLKLHSSLHVMSYRMEMFNAIHHMDLPTIEQQRGNGFYIKVDEALLAALEKVAPLPVEHSDCGQSLGYPEINQAYQELSIGASYRADAVRELKKRHPELIQQLNDSEGWVPLEEFVSPPAADGTAPAALLTKTIVRKGGPDSVFQQQSFVLELQQETLEAVRTIVELSDREKKMLGLEDVETTVFGLHFAQ